MGQARRAGTAWLTALASWLFVLASARSAHAWQPASPERLPSCAAAPSLRADVERRWLPFWLRTLDPVHGGFIVSEPVAGPPVGTKQLVAQARLVWGFSHAYRAGYGPDPAAYLAAAASGVRYLRAHHLDPRANGFYWTTTADGRPLDRRKILYGQAFVIYAFVEYYRASGDVAALADARRLFARLDAVARDRVHGGWLEHFEGDWRPILDRRYLHVDVAGLKSANTHLHVMEALAELADVTPDDAGVRGALAETLALTSRHFFPAPDATVTLLTPEWTTPFDAWRVGPIVRWAREWLRGPLVSYGHNVEFAWLARRAEQVLTRPADRAALDRFLVHALEHGVDLEQGGVYEFGYGDRPAHARDKVWWPQAELLSALSAALSDAPSVRYDDARAQVLAWTTGHQADPATGIWRERVHPSGRAAPGPLVQGWKLNYHDLRAVSAYLVSCGVATLR